MKKKNRPTTTPEFLGTLQKIRGDWGEVKPYARIIPDKKRYDRKQNRKLEREAHSDYRS